MDKIAVTDADREMTKTLREALANICGFWHRGDDDGQLCQALARHRIEAEQRLSLQLMPFLIATSSEQPEKTRLRKAVIGQNNALLDVPAQLDHEP